MRQLIPASLLALMSLCLVPGAATAQSSLTFDEVCDAIGFDADQRAALQLGEIVTADAREASEVEISSYIAIKVPVTLDRVLAGWRDAVLLDFDADLLASGRLPESDGAAEALAEAGFTEKEAEEIGELLEAEPGTQFNLSSEEIGLFAALRPKFKGVRCEGSAACREAVNETYRSILGARIDAYRERGLAGVAPYARGKGEEAQPGAEMRLAAEDMPVTKRVAPEIYNGWLSFPRDQPENAEHLFLWLKRTVEDRPTFVLSHRAIYPSDSAIFWAERHYYAGQFYNSLQMIGYAVPVASGTIIFFANRTSTENVSGFGAAARHKIGRGRVRKDMVATFERLLAAIDQ